MSFRVSRFTVLIGVCLAGQAVAHHSFAMFDRSRSETLNGKVKELDIINPHSWLKVIVKDAQGKESTWSLELGGASQLSRLGWDKLIHPGDSVTVTMHPLRDGSYGGQFVSVTLPDGKILNDGRGPGQNTGGGPPGAASQRGQNTGPQGR